VSVTQTRRYGNCIRYIIYAECVYAYTHSADLNSSAGREVKTLCVDDLSPMTVSHRSANGNSEEKNRTVQALTSPGRVPFVCCTTLAYQYYYCFIVLILYYHNVVSPYATSVSYTHLARVSNIILSRNMYSTSVIIVVGACASERISSAR